MGDLRAPCNHSRGHKTTGVTPVREPVMIKGMEPYPILNTTSQLWPTPGDGWAGSSSRATLGVAQAAWHAQLRARTRCPGPLLRATAHSGFPDPLLQATAQGAWCTHKFFPACLSGRTEVPLPEDRNVWPLAHWTGVGHHCTKPLELQLPVARDLGLWST